MTRFNDISLELRNKIRRELEIIDAIPLKLDYVGELKFEPYEVHLYEECKRWCKIIDDYYRTTYRAYCMTRIGRFEMIKPFRIHADLRVAFEFEKHQKKSWRDWFDVEGKSDGYLQGFVGTVINERTHPQYASLKFT